MPIVTPGSRACWTVPADQTLSLLDIKELDRAVSYCWTVQTRYMKDSGNIRVSFVGSTKGAKSYSYRHALTSAENHLAAAVEWLQQLSSLNGAPAYSLVSKSSASERGYVFTFV